MLEAIKRNPSNPLIYLLLARIELIKGNVADAKKYAEKALSLKPDYQDAVTFISQIRKYTQK